MAGLVRPFSPHAKRWLALLCLVLAWAQQAGASTVFKYRDDDGVWHYTDKRPGGGQQVEVLQLFGSAPEQQRTVFLEKRGTPLRPELYVVNQNFAPAEVRFEFTDTVNTRAPAVPERLLVPGKGELRIASLAPLDGTRPLRYDYRLRWQLGDPGAVPDGAHPYLPPIPSEGVFTVSQAFGGSYSHSGPGSLHAIDIGMPIGTAVRAARSGRVVSVQDSFSRGGNSPSYRAHTNSIYVLHGDGTFGVYAHLRHRSALVQAGQSVQAGQILAQSGNTGYTTGPHLHFAVLRNAGLRWASIPFLLATPAGHVKPVKGLALGAAPAPRLASSAP